MVTTTNSSTTGSARATPFTSAQIIVRPADFPDYRQMGLLAAATYIDDPFVKFMSPFAAQHPRHYARAFVQRSGKRMADPRCISFVACPAADPRKVLGYGAFKRLGDDADAKRLMKSRANLARWLWGWVLWAWFWLVNFVCGGDKSASKEAGKLLEVSHKDDEVLYWNKYPERWYVESCVVGKQFQGRGIGKRLIAEVVARAEKEGKVVGLYATEPGERLYRSMGFDVLGYSGASWAKELPGGAMMLYTPKTLKSDAEGTQVKA